MKYSCLEGCLREKHEDCQSKNCARCSSRQDSHQYVAGRCSTYSKAAFLDVPGYPQKIIIARGAKVQDERGKEYIDFTASLGPIIIGYGHYVVMSAVRVAMKRFGPLSPLPTVLEEGAAKTLCDITGWECVRWCKNGSDALEAAVRLARFLTKRKTVVTNSYHGSHSDLVAAQPGKDGGVLDECINSLVPCRSPDDILKTLSLRDDIAAVVMEPITPEIEDWKLEGIKHTCHQKGALLIFDEIVTGFRVRCGSAVSVQPDLACYGKAIANGWPLACVAGPERLMQTFGNWVFFSSTNAAENLSLAACIATLFYLKHKPRVYDFFRVATKKIVDALQGYGQGYPGRVRIFMPEAVHRHFVGFLAKKGFLVGRDFFLMAMHTRADINRLCSAIREFVELSRGSFSSFPSSGSELGDAPSCPQLEQAGGGFASFPTSDGVEESSPSSTPP